ncbi:hypothetical protein ABGB09_12250 [Streptomyces sp. B8F3]|uniref:hypothetical protein n=1 Tax=Streptomyces sp. B8F3 TaxID=3153573 RepID=UPI00325F351F
MSAKAPGGTERLYADHRFPTRTDVCEDYGHDLATGSRHGPGAHAAGDPAGRAFLKAADYVPPEEDVDDDYPLRLTTGRSVHHWHTRTKTARVPELNAAAPDVWVECSRLPQSASTRPAPGPRPGRAAHPAGEPCRLAGVAASARTRCWVPDVNRRDAFPRSAPVGD